MSSGAGDRRPLAGLVAAWPRIGVATFFSRSTLGRFDADGLNVFFFVLRRGLWALPLLPPLPQVALVLDLAGSGAHARAVRPLVAADRQVQLRAFLGAYAQRLSFLPLQRERRIKIVLLAFGRRPP
jgi:hypothetical protein